MAASGNNCNGRAVCAAWNGDVSASFFEPGRVGEDDGCEYGQAAAFGKRCDVPCHGVRANVCECVSQERARKAMTDLKNGLFIGGGVTLGVSAIVFIVCCMCYRK